MKNFLNKMLISQDKANHFIWTVDILVMVQSIILLADTLLKLNLSFYFIVGASFIITAVIGLLKEIRDYASGKGTPSFMDVLANLYGLVTAFGLIVLVVLAYK